MKDSLKAFWIIFKFLYVNPWKDLLDSFLVLIKLKYYPATGNAIWRRNKNKDEYKGINFSNLRHKNIE